MTNEEKLIDAADKYASNYDGDERQDIKTDVLNAFYQGAAYTSAIEEKHQAQIAMLRGRLSILVTGGEISSADTDKEQLYCEVAKADIKVGRKALSATKATADAFIAGVKARAQIGLLHTMIEDAREVGGTYWTHDLHAIISRIDSKLRNQAQAEGKEEK